MKILLILSLLFLMSFSMFANNGFSVEVENVEVENVEVENVEVENVEVENVEVENVEVENVEVNGSEIYVEEIKIQSYDKTELDKLFEIMRENEEKEWRQGDILIASATILAFFGFASFLTAQFRGKSPRDKKDFLNYINMVLVSIFVIQILQLITISVIMMGNFQWYYYLTILILMGISLIVILNNTRKIISLQNSGEIKRIEGSDMVKQANEKYTHKMLRKAKEVNKELEKLKKSEFR